MAVASEVWERERPLRRPAGGAPLYVLLKDRLHSLVTSRVLEPGESLPAEAELERIYGVSRITVRRAIADLSHSGLVQPRQGRGTYVRDPAQAEAPCLTSFTDMALRRGEVPRSELLSFEAVRGTLPAMDLLGLDDSTPMHQIRRLRLLNGRPLFVSTVYLPISLFPELSATDIAAEGPEQSLYAIVAKAGVVLEHGEEGTCAISADSHVAGLFDLEPQSPVVLHTCLLLDDQQRPALFEEAVWGAPQRARVRVEPEV